jgi:hypothetical protein
MPMIIPLNQSGNTISDLMRYLYPIKWVQMIEGTDGLTDIDLG